MPEPLRLRGIPASPGYAAGPLFHLGDAASSYMAKGKADAEADALRTALAEASARIGDMMAKAPGEAAEILEFQIAMLEDDALTAPAFASIEAGAPADQAWRAALDAEIAGYEQAEEAYFQARSADLRDIRDTVLRALAGDAGPVAPPGAVLSGDDIAPTLFLDTDWSKGGGLALARGSSASHVAMLARARGVPMVVGLGAAIADFAGHVLLDAEHGDIVLGPSEPDLQAHRASAEAFGAAKLRA
ncbi:phosphoenolpyruvate-utilizing N-terminal domain-containing protein, partial [Rhizobiaceae sp. 2RAB30]